LTYFSFSAIVYIHVKNFLLIQYHIKMIRQSNASLGFLRETPEKKPTTGQSVIDGLTANPETFPNLPVDLTTLTSNNNALIAALIAAKTGDRVASANLKTVIKTWNANFRLTVLYVSFVAQGAEAIINLAGCVCTKSVTTPRQKPEVPADFYAASNGTKGLINASCGARNKNALVFIGAPADAEINFNGDAMLVTVGNTTVQVIVTTKNKVSFNNVPGNVLMDMSVYAVNTAGISGLANGQSVIAK
jgi:hypothetical protein